MSSPNQIPIPGTTGSYSAGDYTNIPTTTSASSTASGSTSIWNLNVPDGSQVFTGYTASTANTDTPQKGVKGDVYQTGQAQKNNYVSTDDFYKSIVQMAATDPSSFQQLQMQLFEAGFYGSTALKDIRPGAWTTASATAAKDAVERYVDVADKAGVPMTFSEFLNQSATNGSSTGVGTGTTTGTTTPQVQLTDPAQLTKYFDEAMSASLGRNATAAESQKFVDSFHANETAQQSGTGATQTSTDPRSEALTSAQSVDPTGFQNHQTVGFMDALYNMFLPSSSQVAQTPTSTNSITY